MKKVILGIIVLLGVLTFGYLVIPFGDSGGNLSDYFMDSAGSVSTDKSKFKIFVKEYLEDLAKEAAGIDEDGASDWENREWGEGGNALAAAALSEYEYFTSNNLKGGFRYWNWWDHIPELVASGGDISQFEPPEQHLKSNGVYEKAAIDGTEPWHWCNIFVSCCAQKAGLVTNSWGSSGTNNAPIVMGSSVTHTFGWFTKQPGAMCVLVKTGDKYLKGKSAELHNTLVNTGGAIMSNVLELDTFTPAPGDLAVYTWSNKEANDLHHIGIVVAVEGDQMTIVAGNEKTSEGTQKSVVTKKQYEIGNKNIAGFIRPDYK